MSSEADHHAVIDRINTVVLLNPGINGSDLLASVDNELLCDVADDPEVAIKAYAAAATYCCIDEHGGWWPTKQVSLLAYGDRVKSEPSQRHALNTGVWFEVTTVSAPDDLGLVSVTFTTIDGFIHAAWNGLSPDQLVVYLPAGAQ